jgi:hypothetical protein
MKRTFLILAGLLTAVLGASAQNAFRGGYFMDGYLNAHKMNPALCPNQSYFGIGVGNIDAQTQSNLGISTLFTPDGRGGLDSFLSENVSAQEFLGKLKKYNTENINAEVDIFNLGFWNSKDQFHNLSISVNVIESGAVPYDVFRFLKTGTADGSTYSLAGLGLRARAYGQIAYGISFPVGETIRIGGKVKGLVGLAYADMRFDRFDVTLNSDRWSVASEGRLLTSNLPVSHSSQPVSVGEIFEFDELNWRSLRPSGFGAAIDLGSTWDILPWLQLSASVTDLGFLGWKMDKAVTDGSWEYTGLDEIHFGENDDFDTQMSNKMRQLKELTRFRYGSSGSALDFLPATFYVGAKAHPNDWFSAGLLGTFRSERAYSWAELRAALNLEPADWFGISFSGAYGSFGPKLCSALNLRIPNFLAFFFGAEMSSPYFVSTEPRANHTIRDYINGDVVALPRDNCNINLVFGLNWAFRRPKPKGGEVSE